MTDCIAQLDFDFHPETTIHAVFDAPQISSDGGALLLRKIDDRLGISARIAAMLPDCRVQGRVIHSKLEQLRQRLYQIALGYEDCNDADTLRHDPVLKTVCDRNPEDDLPLSSQPTLSRLENGVTMREVVDLMKLLEDMYVASFESPPETVVLDIDSTDDETHGHQQLAFFHGYYDHHMYHPLLVFDGTDGRLASALLRPGNVHASRGARAVIRRLIRKLKARFPEVRILVRGDSGFCVPAMIEEVESLDAELGGIDYIFGIAKNPVLLDLARAATDAAKERYAFDNAKVRYFSSFSYAAKTWTRERHVIVKAEHGDKGENPRFIVTSLVGFDPRTLYDISYCKRGQCENFIKDFKNALKADRLSCCTFVANSFRLLEHSFAYVLMHALRAEAGRVSPEMAKSQFDTLRLKLLKVAALVKQSVRRILIRLPISFPYKRVFTAVAMGVG